jgi:hypothetical protein
VGESGERNDEGVRVNANASNREYGSAKEKDVKDGLLPA